MSLTSIIKYAVSLNAVVSACWISQNFGYDVFRMDPSLTYCDPADPVAGETINITIGGQWLQEEYVEKIYWFFQFGLFPDYQYGEGNNYIEQDLSGTWTTVITFNVPSDSNVSSWITPIFACPDDACTQPYWEFEAFAQPNFVI